MDDPNFVAALASSGLTPEDARRNGVYYTPNASLVASGLKAASGVVFPYLDPWTGEPMTGEPAWPPVLRVRYLDDPGGWGEQAAKPQRYGQPAGTAVAAYFPPSVSWPALLDDPNTALLITEGEKKALKACREGFPTIGLGGVWNWRSAARGVAFLPELEKVAWARRNVYIVFDSDYDTNPKVCDALNALAKELHLRGAIPHMVPLPQVEGAEKTGLDDYLVARGADALRALLSQEARPLGSTRALFALNAQYVFVRAPMMVLDQRTGDEYSPANFKIVEGNAYYSRTVLRKDGSTSMEQASAAEDWLTWPLRRTVRRVVFEPARPRFGDDGTFNAWTGWAVPSVEGDASPFFDLLRCVTSTSEDWVYDWCVKWFAFQIQRPGTKMFTYLGLHGIGTGTGKTLLGEMYLRPFGPHGQLIRQEDLENGFNSWAEKKQFILGDELTGHNQRRFADKIKGLITQNTVRINKKHVPQYDLRDCANFMFTSNQPDAFFLENDDRRAMIIEVSSPPLPSEKYLPWREWKNGVAGPAALRWHLERVDLTGFDPFARAPVTAAKGRMIVNGRSDLDSWVADLVLDPESTLRVGGAAMPSALYTAAQLLAVYQAAHGERGVSAAGLGRALARGGVFLVYRGQPLAVPGHPTARYYAVRDPKVWLAADGDALREHVRKTHSSLVGKKF